MNGFQSEHLLPNDEESVETKQVLDKEIAKRSDMPESKPNREMWTKFNRSFLVVMVICNFAQGFK